MPTKCKPIVEKMPHSILPIAFKNQLCILKIILLLSIIFITIWKSIVSNCFNLSTIDTICKQDFYNFFISFFAV
jgi:hypothetical protein